jgi:hypothetical protein
MILQWLKANFQSSGTGGLRGYHRKGEVKHALLPYGLDPDILDREFNYLLAAQCLIAEHLRTDIVEDGDLVRLGPAGFVHLDLVGNISYLAAVAEDTWFTDRLQAERVAQRIRDIHSYLTLRSVTENAEELVDHLERARNDLTPPNGSFMQDDLGNRLTDLSLAKDSVNRMVRSQSADPWFDILKRFPRGSRYKGLIVNVVDYGCFVELEDGVVGLIHRTKLEGFEPSSEDSVEVEILYVDHVQQRIGMRLLSIVEEEVGDFVKGQHRLFQ